MLGLAAASLLPCATLLGTRSTALLCSWLAALVLVPIGVARLHSRLPRWFGVVAGDPQVYIYIYIYIERERERGRESEREG